MIRIEKNGVCSGFERPEAGRESIGIDRIRQYCRKLPWMILYKFFGSAAVFPWSSKQACVSSPSSGWPISGSPYEGTVIS
ncbi:MAG: hypothetical protein V4725_14605 [Bacteroidota bacterium]